MAKRGPRKTTPRSDVVLFEQTVRALHVAALRMFIDADDDHKRAAIAATARDPDITERVMKLSHHREMLTG